MDYSLLRNIFVGLVFIILFIFILKPKHSRRLNWALSYQLIWLLFTLPVVNYLCVDWEFWTFSEENSIHFPFDILFIWLFVWLLPFYIFKGKYTSIIALILLWIDILTMPLLETTGILILNSNWWIGEFLMILFVFIPSYFWAKFSFENKHLKFRVIFQTLVMILLLMIVLPFSVKQYETNTFSLENFHSIGGQIIFIIAFPSLVAVIDLVEKGKGTPFPYDKTKHLVTSGVYAYIRNPIQWSFTVLFIPLAIYHQSYLLFVGFLVSLFYTIGVSNPQEYEDMEERFHQKWNNYKAYVPNWYFLWKPKQYPKATIYFKQNCIQCESIKTWFERQEPLNLTIVYAHLYQGKKLQQVTYVNHQGQEFKSVKAIAHAMEHIHLGYATLGWAMRFPVIHYLLQSIIDAFGFSEENRACQME